MESRKRLNDDGTTKCIILYKESGSYSAFSPREAAEAINELKAQLWSGLPLDNQFTKAGQPMENEDYQKTNREKRLTPKSDGAYWCDGCDRNRVPNWGKCSVCGHRQGVKTLKKDI